MKANIRKLRNWDGSEWYAVAPCRVGRFAKVVGSQEVELPSSLRIDKKLKCIVNLDGEASNIVAVGGLLVAPFTTGAVIICEKF